MIDLRETVADPERFGWKAHYLSLMHRWALNVPPAVALSAEEPADGYVAADESTPMAVRSSGLAEDSATGSMAGAFETRLGVVGTEAAREAIHAVRLSGKGVTPMGVVVQVMAVAPVASGVAFSCDPVSLDESRVAISWTPGLGDALVGGAVVGHDLLVDADSATRISGEWSLANSLLAELVQLVRQLAKKLVQPVDVEWCIEQGSGSVTLLQVRPLALPLPRILNLNDVSDFDLLPGQVKGHSKMQLRREATELGVPMSRARAVVATRSGGVPDVPAFSMTRRSAGRSVVLLHPSKVEGRVVREFARDCSTDVEFFVRGCQRYSIRQYPNETDAARTVVATLDVGLEWGPLACVVEQEILHAYATGVIRATGHGYIVELALGHFVPKGYVQTSTFVLDRSMAVVHEARIPQLKAYHFINGHVIIEDPPYEALAVTHEDIRNIVGDLLPMLRRRPDSALEFGVLGETGAIRAYMIDVADSDRDAENLTADGIARGVVSPGVASGPIVDLRDGQILDDLNAHLHEDVGQTGLSPRPAIYVARSASVDLLPLVRSCHPGSGFVFEQASVLAHLPVVLRERGVASVVMSLEQIDALLRDGSARVDTSTHAVASELAVEVLR